MNDLNLNNGGGGDGGGGGRRRVMCGFSQEDVLNATISIINNRVYFINIVVKVV